MFSRNILLLLSYLLVLTKLINALSQPNEVRSTSEDAKDQQGLTTKLTKCAVLHGEHGVKKIITNAKSNDNSINNNYDKRSDRDKLLFYSLNQLTLLSNFTVQHGTQLLRNVLKEASTHEEHSEILKTYLRDFSDYVARAERLKKLNEREKVCELHSMTVLF
ncbi:uncharacterized protein LOC129247345 [Anastrepha obliqua]|uniref:uncharacterized protein LOC129247345 n=1 Tax=Anastrepha obliqua TaxID=95512 RepID=UPI00240A0C33|nr:uncharacterized protein LOC129247345 [Anastrepha obliqua]